MRTFFCFPLEESVRKELTKFRSGVSSPARVKWVNTENLHITVKFLGDIKKGSKDEIISRAKEAVSPFGPFCFTINKLGAFPDISYPKVVWLGSSCTPESMKKLHKRLEESLENLGFEKEDREYIPHITLGRTKDKDNRKVKDFGKNLESSEFPKSMEVRLDRLVLMKSELKRSGPVYERVGQVSL